METRGIRTWWIKAVIIAVAMLLLFIPSVKVQAVESSGTCGDNLTWTLTEEGTLTISGSGKMWDFDSSEDNRPPWKESQYNDNSVKNVIVKNGVTSIGNCAFFFCDSLTNITIPNSVTSIGKNVFSSCSSLSSITIPNSVTSIGGGAFSGCRNLSNIIIPDSVTSIGGSTFKNCTSLSSITIPDSVVSIGPCTFWGCTNLSSVTIPNSVTSIEEYAFHGCSSLSSITIPNSVTSIGVGAFDSCSSLSSITIPNSVTSISYGVFWHCDNLSRVAIPVACTTIDGDAFKYCPIIDVYYEGTKAQWEAISIDERNESLTGARIHYETYYFDPVEAFVSRMYTIILERTPDPTGFRDWTNQLKNHQIDGASFSNGVIMSQEYTIKNDSDETYVNKLYRTFLNREADEDGFNSWVHQLKQGYSRKKILSGFVNSDEFTQICESYGIDRGTMTLTEEEAGRSDGNLHIDTEQVKAYVTRLYDQILGRQPDEEGFNNWVGAITSRQWNAAVVAKVGFFESQEYANKNRTTEEFVTDCYHALMGREPDEAGYNDWVGRLSRGEMTRAEVIEVGFGQSQEFANILRQYGLMMAE